MKQSESLNQIDILNRVNSLKAEIDALKPLTEEQEQRVFQKLRLDWNYHSTAIEGNSLNYGETIAFLMHGVTAKGKPLKDHLDIKGHNQAIDFVMSIIKNVVPFTEADLRSLHQMILVEPYESDAVTPTGQPTKKTIQIGSYKTSPNHVKTATGQMHYYASPEETPIKMAELMEWLKGNLNNPDIHPIVLAGLFHYRFVAIHPFDDGNGRMARIVMNLILMQKSYPPIVIKQEERKKYYGALSEADSGNPIPFIEYLAENMIHSLTLYLKGAKGESLTEPDDFDKELLLFKKELAGNPNKAEIVKSKEVIKNLLEESIIPFCKELEIKFQGLKELYADYKVGVAEVGSNNKWNYTLGKNCLSALDVLSAVPNSNEKNIVFQFLEFKTIKRSFSIELKLIIDFDTFKYSISHTIMIDNTLTSGGNITYKDSKDLTSKAYSQNLTNEDVLKLVSNIARNVLKLTKEEYIGHKL